MTKYLIDVNLPRYIARWENEEFIHQIDIIDEWGDHQIWNYAKENLLTIVTKDSDFSNRMMATYLPPKVIHFRIGNMKLRQFISFIGLRWIKIQQLFDENKLVTVYADRMEAI
jgi:predicted nuclease of predicted toxin-antitoxin system